MKSRIKKKFESFEKKTPKSTQKLRVNENK